MPRPHFRKYWKFVHQTQTFYYLDLIAGERYYALKVRQDTEDPLLIVENEAFNIVVIPRRFEAFLKTKRATISQDFIHKIDAEYVLFKKHNEVPDIFAKTVIFDETLAEDVTSATVLDPISLNADQSGVAFQLKLEPPALTKGQKVENYLTLVAEFNRLTPSLTDEIKIYKLKNKVEDETTRDHLTPTDLATYIATVKEFLLPAAGTQILTAWTEINDLKIDQKEFKKGLEKFEELHEKLITFGASEIWGVVLLKSYNLSPEVEQLVVSQLQKNADNRPDFDQKEVKRILATIVADLQSTTVENNPESTLYTNYKDWYPRKGGKKRQRQNQISQLERKQLE